MTDTEHGELKIPLCNRKRKTAHQRNVVLYLGKEPFSETREPCFNLQRNRLKQLLTLLLDVNIQNISEKRGLFGSPGETDA
jgi:hypothetical protein